MRYSPFLLGPIVCLLLASCAGSSSVDLYRSQGGAVYSDINYSKVDDDDLLDIYLPAGAKTSPDNNAKLYPVLVWIHGGGWRWGSKDKVPVLDLVKSGYGLVSINYRLDGHAKYPAQIDDCRAALTWLKLNGAQYGLDINRLGLIGASAGGHLVALLGTSERNFPELPKIRAVCALYPPTDLISILTVDQRDSSIGLIPLLLGGTVNEKKDLAWEASPVRYVTADSPPFFLIHGQLDTLVPVQQSIELNDALTKVGVSSKLEICPDKKHGFYPDEAMTAEIATFFNKYLNP